MSALAKRVAQSIHESLAARSRDRVGPFAVLLDRTSANVWRNYAVPASGATPSAADIAALVDFFQTRGRTPRLEYVPSDAPAVEPALTEAKFEVEGRPPLMACRRGELTAAPVADGLDIGVVESPEDLLDAARVQDAVYGSTEPTGPDDVARLQNLVRRGGRVVLARDAHTAVPVGSGLVTEPVDGVSELAAIGVIEAYRRRGIASAVTATLTIAAMEGGAEIVWLEPAGAREAKIYQRAGFQPDGEKLWISLPGHNSTPTPVDFDHAPAPLSLRPVPVEVARAVLDGDMSAVHAASGWPHENTAAALWMAVHQGAELWFAYVSGTVVGEAGTMGPPDAGGVVEIGYGLAEPYQGYAGTLAASLTNLLLARDDVQRVVDMMVGAGSNDRPDAGPPEVDGTEAQTLMAFIGYLRDSVIRKVAGLSDGDARKPMVASGTSLLGLLKHVAHVEVFWLHQAFAGGPADLMPDDKLADDDTVASLTEACQRIAAASEAIVPANADLTAHAKHAEFRQAPTTLRWILVHLVEELGRHAGHADIIREQIDGTVGR